MIEMEIPKDIRKYEAKLIGPLTTRQTVCFVLAASLGVGIYALLDFLPQDFKFLIIMIVAAPLLLCGWVKPYGMHFEKFVQTAIVTTVLAPTNRKYVTKNIYNYDDNLQKQTKNKGKNKKEKVKKSKEYISYN